MTNQPNPQNEPISSPLDEAISSRLEKLRTMPVDTANLDRLLGAQLPQRQGGGVRRILSLRPLRAAAASLLVLLTIAGLLLMTWSAPVLASASEMAQMHRDILANKVPVVQVNSIDEASLALASQSSRTLDLPQAPEAHVMACCMKNIKDKQVACVLLRSESSPITLSVGRAKDMRLPNSSPSTLRDGVRYYIQSSGALNMVMAERQDRWICLIGELPSDRLIELAAGLQFD